MIALEIELRGIPEAVNLIEKGIKNTKPLLSRYIVMKGEQIITRGKELVPVETGYLKGTGSVGSPKTQGDTVTLMVGFYADYAYFVHENLTARHVNGQAKYLEQAVIDIVENRDDIGDLDRLFF